MKIHAFLLLLVSLTFAADVSLIHGGKSCMAIVVEDAANPVLALAGSELASHLEARTGGKIQVLSQKDKVPENLYPVYLGLSPRTRKLGADDARIRYDGYFFKVTGKYAVIAGRDKLLFSEPYYGHTFMYGRKNSAFTMFGERGTLNGVYKMLEKYAGVRHYMPGDLGTVIPTSPEFALPETETYLAPAFIARNFTGVWFRDGSMDFLRWHHRLCAGGVRNPVNHSYNRMFRFKDSHPEYFALINGKRDMDNLSTANHYGNLCMTNREGIKAFAELAKQFFDRNPDYDIFPIVPQDGLFKVCECPDCQKLLSPHLGPDGKFSNLVFHHAIEIAKLVKKTNPGKYIGVLAYENYRNPPEMEIPDNMLVVICYRRQQLNNPKVKLEREKLFRGYEKKNAKMMVWTYALFNHIPPMRGIPVLYSKILQENIRFNRDHNVIGEKSEASYRSGGGDQLVKTRDFALPASTHLNDYIRCQLLWDPDQDVAAMLDEYYRLFYGPAQQEMRQYWETAESLFMEKGEATMYTADDLKKLERLVQAAIGKTEPGTPYGKRVRLLNDELKPFFETMYLLRSGTKAAAAPLVNEEIPLDYSEQGVWKYARTYRFTTKAGQSVDDANSTILKLLANKKGIAFHLLANEPFPAKMVARASRRDDPVAWRDDCYELFLVNKDRSVNLQYIITAAGNINDAHRSVDINVADWAWNSGLQMKQSKGNSSWTTTIFIPWSDLDCTLDTAKPMLIEIFRRQTGGDLESGDYQVLFPTAGFHNYSPEYFGEFHLIPAGNQLKNGSFNTLTPDGFAANWGKRGRIVPNAFEKSNALYLCNSEKQLYDCGSIPFKVTGGTEYMLHCVHKGGAGYMYALFFDAKGKGLKTPDTPFFYCGPAKEWKPRHFQGRIPKDAVTGRIILRCFEKKPESGAYFSALEFSSGNAIK